jgi:hypothetical protein
MHNLHLTFFKLDFKGPIFYALKGGVTRFLTSGFFANRLPLDHSFEFAEKLTKMC